MSIHTEGPHLLRQVTGTSTMKARTSSGLRKLATDMNGAYPEMDVHQHLQDAARELDSGRTHSAQRHVNAAIFGLTPLQLRRHGVQDDAGHMRGKAFMQQAHRHLLLIKDIEDVHGSNRDLRQQRRDDRDQERTMRAAAPPVAVAASWDTHLNAIELATFAGKPPGSGHNFAKLQGVLAKRGAKNPGALAAYIGRKKYGRKRFAKLGRGSKHASQLDALELAYRFKHGWIKIDGMGSAAEVAASGAGFPLETRPKRKGPGALIAAHRTRRRDRQGEEDGRQGHPAAPDPARAAAVEASTRRSTPPRWGRTRRRPSTGRCAGRDTATAGRWPCSGRSARASRPGRLPSRSPTRTSSAARPPRSSPPRWSRPLSRLGLGRASDRAVQPGPAPRRSRCRYRRPVRPAGQPASGQGQAAAQEDSGSPAHPTANQQKKAQRLAQDQGDREDRGTACWLSQLAKGQISALAARNAATKAGQIGKTPGRRSRPARPRPRRARRLRRQRLRRRPRHRSRRPGRSPSSPRQRSSPSRSA